jgi:hypothetical protein
LPVLAVRLGFCASAAWVFGVAAAQAGAPLPPAPSWAQRVIDGLPEPHRSLVSHGSWRVIVIDPSCDTCQRVVTETESGYASGEASERLLLVLTGADPDAGRRFLPLVEKEVLQMPAFVPPCLPALVVLQDGIVTHGSCRGSPTWPPQSDLH